MTVKGGSKRDPLRAEKARKWGIFIKKARAAAAEKLGRRVHQTEFAEMLGIPVATLQQWEIGRRRPYPFYTQMVLEKLDRLGLTLRLT